jgi:hypothetical protein
MVLGQKTNFTPGTQVYFKDTYQEIIDAMGIDLDEFGVQGSTGKPWVHQWIGFAFKSLKNDNGLCAQNMKGRWELTEAGCLEARRLCGTEADAPTAPAFTVEALAEAVEPAMPATIGGRSFVTPKVPEGFYHHDSYIRSIAIKNTRCFGNFSDRSRVCNKCPLKEACLQYMAVEYAAMAAMMRREEKEAVELAATADAAAKAAPVAAATAAAAVENTTGDKPAAKGMEKIVAALESDCAHCDKTIPKGEKCMWSPGSGLYHVGCVQGA